MKIYDAIIIGAGPCGAVAANTLAKNGKSVLLLEKQKLPRYKSCSGVLIEKSIRFIEQQLGQSVPPSVTCTPAHTRGMVFTTDTGREYKFESDGLNIWRDKFDAWLVSLGAKSGACVRDERSVTALQEEDGVVCVRAGGKKEYAKFAIDCSGAAGIGKHTRRNVITYQTYNRGNVDLDERYFYAYLQPEFSAYDAWFNVKDGMLVLGVACFHAHDIANYYSKFTAYLTEKHNLHVDERLKTDQWLIREIQPPFAIDYGAGGILKAGEAAGFLNPMGEGISCGMESGYAAALAILSHLNDRENVLAAYRKNAAETENYMKRQWQLVGRMSDRFAHMK